MKLFLFLLMLTVISCNDKKTTNTNDLNVLAEKYVRLGLDMGQYDTDFVDAYYGPDSLKPAGVKPKAFPKDSFVSAVNSLTSDVSKNYCSRKE